MVGPLSRGLWALGFGLWALAEPEPAPRAKAQGPRSKALPRSVLDRFEQLADELLDADRELLWNGRGVLGDQRREAARSACDRGAHLLALVALGLGERDVAE